MQCYPDGARQTSVGGHSGRKCGGGCIRHFGSIIWFNHFHTRIPESRIVAPGKTVMNAQAGHPVRRGLSIQLLPSLECRVAPSSRVMTNEYASALSWCGAPLAPRSGHGLNRLAVDAGLAL